MEKSFIHKNFFLTRFHWITILWFLIPTVAVILLTLQGPSHYNNYLIFKHVFWNSLQQKDLYDSYPNLYNDKNHYGPFFSIIIAPFALLPNFLGIILWTLFNISILFFAIHKLNLSENNNRIVLLLCLVETLTSVQNLQFNPMLVGWIILSFVYVREGKLSWASLFIVAGTFVKLYGVVGLAFLFFTRSYKKMIIYLLIWALVFFLLPMLISNPSFICKSYLDWFHSLVEKHNENINSYQFGSMTDISAMGFVKRITCYYSIPNLYFLLPAAFLSLMPLTRTSFYYNANFQLFYLAQLLIGLVIFSSSAESPTYVIAVVGFSIWYIHQSKSFWNVLLLIMVLLLTILSPTDLFPKIIREQYIIRYSLKALPCLLSWLTITYDLLFKNYNTLKFNETKY